MARINIEDSIYRDNRFIKLCMKTGSLDAAIGALVRAWSLAQQFYLLGDRMVPLADWQKQEISPAIIEVGLATETDGRIRVDGADEQFHWLLQRSEAGAKSAQARAERKATTVERPLPAVNGSQPLTLTPPLSQKKDEDVVVKKPIQLPPNYSAFSAAHDPVKQDKLNAACGMVGAISGRAPERGFRRALPPVMDYFEWDLERVKESLSELASGFTDEHGVAYREVAIKKTWGMM